MEFPYFIPLFNWSIHPHTFFESLAFICSFSIQFFFKSSQEESQSSRFLWISTLIGALLGAKILHWLEIFPSLYENRYQLKAWLGGKTIVGALIGGWLGLEIAKRKLKWQGYSSSSLVYAIIFGICIGRIGCFLTGLEEETYGSHTTLPWGVDFGDGPRHPTQIYEIIVLFSIAVIITIALKLGKLFKPGEVFRFFILIYFIWRFSIDFIKPHPWIILHTSVIQWACLVMIPITLFSWRRLIVNYNQNTSNIKA